VAVRSRSRGGRCADARARGSGGSARAKVEAVIISRTAGDPSHSGRRLAHQAPARAPPPARGAPPAGLEQRTTVALRAATASCAGREPCALHAGPQRPAPLPRPAPAKAIRSRPAGEAFISAPSSRSLSISHTRAGGSGLFSGEKTNCSRKWPVSSRPSPRRRAAAGSGRRRGRPAGAGACPVGLAAVRLTARPSAD
jgi:hypothetical protein